MHPKYLFFLLLLPALLQAEPLRVFVSVSPLQTIVQRVGGERVQVQAMVQPGHSPHSYDPTPRQIGALAQTVLYVRSGVPFEDAWMARIRSANSAMQVLDAREGIGLRELDAHDHGGPGPAPAPHDRQDPHIWTSPPLVEHMARNIRDRLAALDPGHADTFSRNFESFAAELDGLDRDLRALLDPLPNRRFLVFHPAWGYFADTYGLTQVPIEYEGKEPGARTLAALIERARREGARVIFVQPQFNRAYARQLADAIGGRVVVIDPLAANYIPNLRRVGHAIAEALSP
jgi:zinc transport system substrate-binding protein